jgi:hypothetical protein
VKTDLSNFLCERYFLLKNKKITMTLKNSTVFRGVIVGFYRQDDSEDSPVIKWHLLDADEINLNPMELMGASSGRIIRHKDIVSIKFDEDNSVMNF